MKPAKKILGVALIAALLLSILPLGTLAAASTDHYSICAGGSSHSLLVDASGSVWVWGENDLGQLGLGRQTVLEKEPKKLPQLTNIVEVSAGYTFSAALSSGGLIFIWGQYGDSQTYWEPTRVGDLADVIAIRAGQTRLLALTREGKVYEYSLGGLPLPIQLPEVIVKIAAGGDFYLALGTSGTVYTWGSNSKKQLGRDAPESSPEPLPVAQLGSITDIAAGYTHALALDDKGKVWAWGSNTHGELGVPLSTPFSSLPLELGASQNSLSASKQVKYTAVSAGYSTSMAISDTKTVYAWGYGEYGQLGNGSSKSSETPSLLKDVKSGAQITSGVYHNLCVSTDGTLYTWGRNKGGQLGNRSTGNLSTPVSVFQGLNVSKHSENPLTKSASPWATQELDGLYRRNLVPPYAWSKYQDYITRAEFAAILVDVYETVTKSIVPPSKSVKFTDTASSPFTQEIQKAVSLQLIDGKTASSFDPDGPLTRQEAAKMLSLFSLKARNLTANFEDKTVSNYTDAASISTWALPYVSFAYSRNIMKGNTNGQFCPFDKLTKEEGLLVLARMADQYAWSKQ